MSDERGMSTGGKAPCDERFWMSGEPRCAVWPFSFFPFWSIDYSGSSFDAPGRRALLVGSGQTAGQHYTKHSGTGSQQTETDSHSEYLQFLSFASETGSADCAAACAVRDMVHIQRGVMVGQ